MSIIAIVIAALAAIFLVNRITYHGERAYRGWRNYNRGSRYFTLTEVIGADLGLALFAAAVLGCLVYTVITQW